MKKFWGAVLQTLVIWYGIPPKSEKEGVQFKFKNIQCKPDCQCMIFWLYINLALTQMPLSPIHPFRITDEWLKSYGSNSWKITNIFMRVVRRMHRFGWFEKHLNLDKHCQSLLDASKVDVTKRKWRTVKVADQRKFTCLYAIIESGPAKLFTTFLPSKVVCGTRF